ncbi:g11565 [Coccomyxa elongata]
MTAGLIMLFAFGIFRRWVPTYKLRLTMPNVWIKPPPLPEGGIQQLWSWLYPVFTTSDADLVRTAGLDSLMLVWTASLGIQIFLPLTIVGMAILLPFNLYGQREKHFMDVTTGAVAFQRLTLSSLERGSQQYWVAFAFVYLATAYVCWLLLKYYQAHAILRQRYMTGGEALINQWHDRIINGQANSTLTAKATASTPAIPREGTPATEGDSAKFWNAVRGLIDVNTQMGNLTESLGESSQNSLDRLDIVPDKKMSSLEDVSLKSLPATSSAALRAHLRQSPFMDSMHNGRRLATQPEDDEAERDYSLRSCYMKGEDGAVPSGQAMTREQELAEMSAGESETAPMGPLRLRYLPGSSTSASDMEAGLAGRTAEPISRYESKPPKDAGGVRLARWWGRDGDGAPDGQALAGKPSVFFRKTVNAHTADGRCVAVNAQQYAVLVLDVPDLRVTSKSQRSRQRKGNLKPWWQRSKAWLYPAVKKRKHSAAEGRDQSPSGSLAAADSLKEVHLDLQGMPSLYAEEPVAVEEGAKPALRPTEPKAESRVQEVFESNMSVGEESWHEEVASLTPTQLVEATFRRLFPDTFQYALPVWKHKSVDQLLWQWDEAYSRLLRAEARFEATGCSKRPTHRSERCGGPGSKVDTIDFWAQRVRQIETAIHREQHRILGGPTTLSFFAFFLTQKDAALAAQTRIHSEDGHSFRVMEAPGPEEVNWQVLWKTSRERSLREVLVFPLIVFIMLVPMGLFSGTLAQATAAICGGPSAAQGGGRLSFLATSWYCRDDSLARPLITSLLPSLLLTTWQSLIMPIVLYIFAQMEGQHASLSSLDRRISGLFFTWGVFNVFLGAMLGGSIFSKIRLILEVPVKTPDILGAALTTSSNFFINFVIIQAFAVNPSRILFPHFGVVFDLLKCCGCCRPHNEKEKVWLNSSLSIGYGREIGVIMLIYIMALAYAASSPIILPFALCYFLTAWVMWRYTILYMTERCYESGGLLWDQVFNHVCWCLFIFEFFTGCVFLANSAFVQASLLWVTLTPLLYKFHSYARARYGEAVAHMPLETALAAPEARVAPMVYTPPSLRPGASGWYPEYGKAWENWGVPLYVP